MWSDLDNAIPLTLDCYQQLTTPEVSILAYSTDPSHYCVQTRLTTIDLHHSKILTISPRQRPLTSENLDSVCGDAVCLHSASLRCCLQIG